MRIDEINKQIDEAIAEEQKSGRLRAWFVAWGTRTEEELSAKELDALAHVALDCVRAVPKLLSALENAARQQKVLKEVQPLLDRCEAYWFEGQDLIPDHLGLLGFMDDAYYVLSVFSAVSDWFRKRGSELFPSSLARARRVLRQLIGNPYVTKLDTFTAAAVRAFPVRDLLQRPKFRIPVLDPDPLPPPSLKKDEIVFLDFGESAPTPPAPAAPMSDLLGVDEPEVQSRPKGAGGPPKGARSPPKRASSTAVATAKAKPPAPAAPASPPAATPPKRPAAPEAGLFMERRPKRRAEPVSTGFATAEDPGEPIAADAVIVAGAKYYFWFEVGEVTRSIEAQPVPLPVEFLPARATLNVVLFSPDSGLTIAPNEAVGQLELQPDGSAPVGQQPAKKYANVDKQLLLRRLLFPVVASKRLGQHRLRCSIYCSGVLVQSRCIDVTVGGTDRISRVDYTLATKLNPAKLQSLGEHRFSILSNHRPGGNHDFYIYGARGEALFHESVTIPAEKLKGALNLARAAMQRASWGDEDAWTPRKKYRYLGTLKLDETVSRLRQDLAVLAIAGWRIYVLLANRLAGGGSQKLADMDAVVRQPGLVQIAPDANLGLVLPAALIYDYKLGVQDDYAANFLLCPEFERAFRAKSPLAETACFQGQCPSRGEPTTVCPSGFWGFRHGLGLPITELEEGDDEREKEFDTRLEYKDIPVIVIGVSRAKDLPRTGPHIRELVALRPAWKDRGWLVADSLKPLLELMSKKEPHIVYMYCHGSGREVGKSEIPMLYLGEDPENAKPGEWLESASLYGNIQWTKPRPLVFLNGCHTTKLDTESTLDFVEGFVQYANACGVIGTEITVFEELAGAFARRFMDRFLGGAVVGQAIRDARLDLLMEGNPLGLVYTPFVLAGTRLVQAK